MKKLSKIFAITLAVLLSAASVLPLVFEGKIGDIVKREAAARLRVRLGFEKLDVSLLRHFPHASLDVRGLTLAGGAPFAGDTIAAADRISVVVNLLSLFGDEGIEVTKVIAVRPAVHARKLADGTVNWDVMKPVQSDAERAAEPSGPSSFRLAVRDVRIDGAVLRYEDDSTRMRFSASPLSLRLRGDLSAAQTDLSLRLEAGRMRLVSGDAVLLADAEGELDAVLSADLEQRRFVFAQNTLRLNAVELSLGGRVDLAEPGAVAVDLAAECRKVQFKDILSMIPAFYTRDFRSLSASGELSLAAWAKGRLAGGEVPAFEVKLGVREGAFRYVSLPKAVTDIAVDARVSNAGGTIDDTKVEMPLLTLTMDGNTVRASFAASHLFSDPHFDAAVSGRADLGGIREVYPLRDGEAFSGIVTADLRAAGRMSDIERERYESVEASGTFVVEDLLARMDGWPDVHVRRAAATVSPAAMTLGELNLAAGRSDLAANGRLTGYIGYLLRGSKLSGRLYVESDRLDLNELLSSVPASQQREGVQQPAVSAAADTAAHAPVIPANLDLALSAELHEVLFRKMRITNLSGGVRVADGAVLLDGLAMEAFGGRVNASGCYSTVADAQRPELRLGLDVAKASFERTFEELEVVQRLVPLFAKTGGSYSMRLDLAARLDASMTPELKTLNAAGTIASQDVRIRRIEAFSKLADALRYEPLRQIEARDVAIRFTIADGRITTEPFDLRIAGAAVRLSGTTGPDRTIDYKARVSLPEGAAGGVLTTLDVGIGGTFSDPKITLGVKEAAVDALKNLVNEQVRKLTGSAPFEAEVDEQRRKIGAAVGEQRGKRSAEAEHRA
ncbi:AsmA-like C-terminal region-containing protein [uncultured Alistipes sp.]|uniref:AsmA-like C-terminal region-containing protein n=1 Tax=uncultured Alistipes sp. TaxID=538949 RepID=UPI00261FF871|nr:AsmA-like C-terminal region-containing protein [uncultured Alistipes sp.]